MSEFSRIGLIGRAGSAKVADTLLQLETFLHARGNRVVMETQTAALLPALASQTAVCERERLGEHCELVIVVGGDGSMLGAARALCRQAVPVLGINRGSLGFLTDISPEEIETRVGEVLAGHYLSEERFLLDVTLMRGDTVIAEADALNEVVLHRGSSLRMIEFELYVHGQFVYSQHSDGLVVSTPTGSTAYALSGGGPILHPALDAIALVPMFSHALTSRPIVVTGDSEIRIVLGEHSDGCPELSCDGQIHFAVQRDDVMHVRKKSQTLKLIHPRNHNYYETCRSKLGWGSCLG